MSTDAIGAGDQIGVGGFVFVPSGPSESYVGEGSVYGQPQLYLGGRAPYFVWSASAGSILRASANPHTVTFQGGAALEVLDGALRIGPEVYGSVALQDTPFATDGQVTIPRRSSVNLEGLLGAQGYVQSLMILINLTGGTYFEATAKMLELAQ